MKSTIKALARFIFGPCPIIGYINLTYQELMCLDMVGIYLRDQYNNPRRCQTFLTITDRDIQRIEAWLNQEQYRQCLRLDGSNHIDWPLYDHRDVAWLYLGLDLGTRLYMQEQCAKHQANLEVNRRDYTDTPAGHAQKEQDHQDICERWVNYYTEIVRCKTALLRKLRVI